jgi:hypothetical protein
LPRILRDHLLPRLLKRATPADRQASAAQRSEADSVENEHFCLVSDIRSAGDISCGTPAPSKIVALPPH